MKINFTKNELDALKELLHLMPNVLYGQSYVLPGFILDTIKYLKTKYNTNILNNLEVMANNYPNPKFGIVNVFNFVFDKFYNSIEDQGFTKLEKHILALLCISTLKYKDLYEHLRMENFPELEAAYYENNENETLLNILNGLEEANVIEHKKDLWFII